MASWTGEPTLASGEHILWQRLANRQQGPNRSMGGRIFLTELRVIFLPNRVDEATGGIAWCRDLSDIAAVTVEPRHFGVPFVTANVGLRKRLRIEARDAAVDLFLVNGLSEAVHRIEAAIATRS